MSASPVRIGIVGCGMVADEYAATLASAPQARLIACTDLNGIRAQDFASRHGISSLPIDRLLDPATIDLAVLLTPPHTHADLALRAIDQGLRAIFTEKPFTTDPDDAATLLSRAEEAQVLLGAAPDTLLGPALETAAAALTEGLIGDLRSATATLFSTGPERWHPAPEPFYSEHAGPLGDMGPYYLTALDYLLGPLHVRASTALTHPERRIRSGPRAGTAFAAHTSTYVAALLETAMATPVTLITSFDAVGTQAPHLEIHGTDGTLTLPDPNFHEGQVLHRAYDVRRWEALPQPCAPRPAKRGVGVLDLIDALHESRPPRCCSRRAERIVRLTHAIVNGACPPIRRPEAVTRLAENNKAGGGRVQRCEG